MQKQCPLYRDVRLIEIFSKIVLPQSKAIRFSSYCPSYRGARFIVCSLFRDSTVELKFGLPKLRFIKLYDSWPHLQPSQLKKQVQNPVLVGKNKMR